MEPRLLLAFFADGPCSAGGAHTSSSFSSLQPGSPSPAYITAEASSFPSSGLCICPFSNFIRVLSACSPSLSWSLWTAVLPSAYQLFIATWWHLQAFQGWVFSWSLISLGQFRSLQHYRVFTCLQVEYDPLTITLWAWPPKQFFTYLVLPPRL